MATRRFRFTSHSAIPKKAAECTSSGWDPEDEEGEGDDFSDCPDCPPPPGPPEDPYPGDKVIPDCDCECPCDQ